MVSFEKIKLIIWDLDDTFWNGTLSEGGIVIPDDNRNLICELTDIGIINSICSKNDADKVCSELEKQGLNEYFVFSSVNWESKGNRVKQLISDMQLRPENVLFLDDNPSNRGEVQHYCPEIMVDGPECIPDLVQAAHDSEKKDPEHKRLKQYRILEEKKSERTHYESNEDFLFESNIHLEIHHDCINQINRIHDLILRSNQLNFTKLRSSEDELRNLLDDETVKAGYVTVCDRWGDYGIVGFYAIKKEKLVHFTFSCRTLGMGIEQYVYNVLKRPELEVSGEVISDLSSAEIPKWINHSKEDGHSDKMTIHDLREHTVLIKGPCDLFQIYPYIAQTELFDTEFTYVTDGGLTIESTGHTTHIVEAGRLSDEQKQLVLSEVPFTDKGMYNDNIFKNHYKVVFISILTDANLGVYQRKETGEKLAFLEYLHPITAKDSWPGLISGEYNHGGFNFTEQILKDFSEKYEFIGRNTPEQILDNMKYIRDRLPKDCLLAIMLGGEIYYEKNTFPAYNDRHTVHKSINKVLRDWAADKKNICLLDVNKYLVDQSSFYDHFNHYIKPVYYQLASEMVNIVNEWTGSRIRETSKMKMLQIRLKEALAPTYYKLRKILKGNHHG